MEGQGLLCAALKVDACPNTENHDAMLGAGWTLTGSPPWQSHLTGLSAWLYHRSSLMCPIHGNLLFPRPLSIPSLTKNTSTE